MIGGGGESFGYSIFKVKINKQRLKLFGRFLNLRELISLRSLLRNSVRKLDDFLDNSAVLDKEVLECVSLINHVFVFVSQLFNLIF